VDCRRRIDGDKTREAHELHLAKRAVIEKVLHSWYCDTNLMPAESSRKLLARHLADALYPSPYEPGEEPQ
jgi:hypothetical protein